MRAYVMGSGLGCGSGVRLRGRGVGALLENRRALQAQVALEFYRRYAEIAARMPNERRFAGYGDAAGDRMPEETRTKAALAMTNT
jgi:hypothetical protein